MKSPRRWSLRARLLAGVLTLVALGFTCAGFASVKLLGNYLTDRIDDQLYIARQELIGAPPEQVKAASGEGSPGPAS